MDLVHELDDATAVLRGRRDLLAEAPRRATPVARITEAFLDRGNSAYPAARLTLDGGGDL